ncbi:cupin domain-containing protein [Bauldia sp.]|uniref:cupin domain-containing protein n=1 Tax=Bauldia sp. TaxID=2575872 RepID=UPI003BAD8009
METRSVLFADDGDIPNSRFPLIVYPRAVDPSDGAAAVAFETLFARNGWGNSWRNGIFPFHHYHSNAHEVLGIAAGSAEVRFGGENGETVAVEAGDAVLIPAGVGHKRLSASPDLLVVGAYPASQHADLMREGAEDTDGIRRRIAGVVLPENDPVGGPTGPTATLWV